MEGDGCRRSPLELPLYQTCQTVREQITPPRVSAMLRGRRTPATRSVRRRSCRSLPMARACGHFRLTLHLDGAAQSAQRAGRLLSGRWFAPAFSMTENDTVRPKQRDTGRPKQRDLS